MKKTEKTALTAAIFAAALYGGSNAATDTIEASASSTSTTTVVGARSDMVQPVISQDIIDDLNSKMSAVYGPPPSYNDDKNEEDDIITTTTELVTLYAPPAYWITTPVPDEAETSTTTTDRVIAEFVDNMQDVYGPPPIYGDMNYDGRVNVFDFIKLRERFVRNDSEYVEAGDLNLDRKISVADLVVLQNFLLGKIDRDEPLTTDTTEEAIPQPSYGPPYWETTTVPEEDDVDTPEVAPLYGPPPSWNTTTTTTTTEDVVQTARTELAGVYGPPSWFTTPVTEKEDATTTVVDEEE